VSHNVGAFLIPWIAGPCLYYFGWRYALYIPGIICILFSFYLFKGLRDTPESLGLPPIEAYRKDYGENAVGNESEDAKMSQFRVLWLYVLKNPYVWLLATTYFFVYVVRTGIGDWTALFLLETKGYSLIGATGFVSLFELGGFCGSLVAGWSSDRFFSARRGPVNALFAGGMIVTILTFWLAPPGHQWLDSTLMFLVGFSIFGPQLLVGVAAAELTHKSAAATSNGFVGCAGYMGAACAGGPLGMIIQELGWEAFFLSLVVCSGLSLLALLPMWNISKNRRLAVAV
jgi:OPA family sugar phosphate sensor protein UhpC-like MFS transporter